MDENSVQHFGLIVAAALAAVGGGVFLAALLGGWLDAHFRLRPAALAAAVVLLASAAAALLAYRPIAGRWPTSDLANDVVQRMLWAAAAVAVLLAAARLLTRRLPTPARVSIAVALAIALPAGLLVGSFVPFPAPDGMSRAAFLLQQLGPALLATLLPWALTEPIAARSPGAAAPLVGSFVAAGAAAVLLPLPSKHPALLAAVITAAIVGTLVAAWIAALLPRRLAIQPNLAGGPVLLWFAMLAALAAYACLDADTVPWRSSAILAATPAVAWVVEIGPIRRWRPWKRELLRAALLAIPVLLVAIPALVQVSRDAAEG